MRYRGWTVTLTPFFGEVVITVFVTSGTCTMHHTFVSRQPSADRHDMGNSSTANKPVTGMRHCSDYS